MSSYNEDTQIFQVHRDDFVHEVHKVGWGIGRGHGWVLAKVFLT